MPLGDVRIVGQVKAGAVSFQAGENPQGEYFVVTKAFVNKLYALAYKVRIQEQEIKRLEAETRGKK